MKTLKGGVRSMSSLTLIRPPKGWGTRSIGVQRVKEALQLKADGKTITKSFKEAVKDWWCGTDTLEVLENICTLKSTYRDAESTEEQGAIIKKKFEAYQNLAARIGADHIGRIEISTHPGTTPSHYVVNFKILGLGEDFPTEEVTLSDIESQCNLVQTAKRWFEVYQYSHLSSPEKTNQATDDIHVKWEGMIRHYSKPLAQQILKQYKSERAQLPFEQWHEFQKIFLKRIPSDIRSSIEKEIFAEFNHSDEDIDLHLKELTKNITSRFLNDKGVNNWLDEAIKYAETLAIDHPEAVKIKNKVLEFLMRRQQQLSNPYFLNKRCDKKVKKPRSIEEKNVQQLYQSAEEYLYKKRHKCSDKSQPHWEQRVDEFLDKDPLASGISSSEKSEVKIHDEKKKRNLRRSTLLL